MLLLRESLETVNLDFSLLGDTFVDQEFSHLDTLITLHLDNFTVLLIFDDCAVTGKCLFYCLQ